MKLINLRKYLATLKVIHTKNVETAIRTLTFHKVDATVFTHTEPINLANATRINGELIYIYEVNKIGDIVDEIKISINRKVKIDYVMSGYAYKPEDFDEYLVACAYYLPFTIMITFLEEPQEDDKFFITLNVTNVNLKHHALFIRSYVYTRKHIYYDGTFHTLNSYKDELLHFRKKKPTHKKINS
jgi:hypothetical protein